MAIIPRVDWDIIDARVQRYRSQLNGTLASTAYLWIVLEQYFPGSESERSASITDGGEDQGIDAIHISETDGSAEIYLFQAKYRETQASTSKTLNESEALKILSFIKNLFEKSKPLGETGNVNLDECVKRIWEIHSRGVICRYRIVMCSNDQGISRSAQTILNNIKNSYEQVTWEFYSHKDLIKDLATGQRQSETGSLQIIGKEIFERTDGDVRGAIASIDANSFLDLICTEQRQNIKRYLFDDNLRIYLGSAGGFNSQIISTAHSDDNYLFWYLNNGVTITCKNYTYNKGHANPKLRLVDFQIVNGAQTSNALLEASRHRPDLIENIVLLVRVYATDRSDIIERVAVATNSQAKIQFRDLKSNREILKKLELAFFEKGYYFERKRNMHSDKHPDCVIDALKLGQIIMSFYLGDPDKARAASDSVFDERFRQLFNESYNIDDLCKVFVLYRYIENMKDRRSLKSKDSSHENMDVRYLAYGHWHVLYACSVLLKHRKITIPTGNQIRSIVLEAISVVARACDNQQNTSQYQIFRGPKTKARIFLEITGPQPDLFDFLGGNS